MHFEDVIGQQQVIDKLVGLVEQNRLSHALLISGKEGTGVLPLAISFGQYVVSQSNAETNPSPTPDLFGTTDLFGETIATNPDAEIQTTELINAQAAQLIHPDLHFSYPVIPKKSDSPPVSSDYSSEWREFYKQMPYGTVLDWLQSIGAENQQGNITARECNEIIRKLSLKSFSSRYKVLVMWLPEYLGKEGNKLLKLIEEPPPDTLFILATHHEEQLLPTIVSRCQTIKVPPILPADLEQALVERCQLEPAKARQLALTCEGNYLEALQLLQHSEDDLNGLLRDWLNAALLRGPKAHERFDMQVKFIDQVSRLGRERQKQLLRYLLQLIEQSLRLRLVGEDKLHLPESELAFAARLNKMSGIGQQRAIAAEVDKAIYYIERNANAKMLFHALLLKLRAIVLDKTILLTT